MSGYETLLKQQCLLPERKPRVHSAKLLQRGGEEALIRLAFELEACYRVSLETPCNRSLAARQPDRELDLILEGRERRDTGEILKQSAQRLLKCCEVGRLPGDVAFCVERRGRGPRDFERHHACEPVVVERVASLTLPLVALDVQSQMEPVAAQIDLNRFSLS